MTRFIPSALAAGLVLLGAVSTPAAVSGQGYALIVSPARYSVLQVCFDVVQRESAVLVSYQGESSTAEPRLHAWNGVEWTPVSMQDFREASFLEQTPSRTILIGDDKTLPAVIADAATWAARTDRIKDLTSSALVNDFGRIVDWGSADWKWFAARYNLQYRTVFDLICTVGLVMATW